MPREKSVGAIVFRLRGKERRFLLLLYEAGHWDFPKGHIEGSETEKQAMLRELEEETGIAPGKIRVIPSFRETIHYFFRSNGRTVFKEVVFFLVESKQSRVRLSFEHHSHEWLAFGEAVEKATFKTAKQLLEKANSFLKQQGGQAK